MTIRRTFSKTFFRNRRSACAWRVPWRAALPAICGLLALSALTRPARAGSYVIVSETGGVVTTPHHIPTNSYNCGGNPAAYGGYFNSKFFRSGHFNISGAITAVFHWQPDQVVDPVSGGMIDDSTDTPPLSVVVYETSTSVSQNDDWSQSVGKVDNGLDSPP